MFDDLVHLIHTTDGFGWVLLGLIALVLLVILGALLVGLYQWLDTAGCRPQKATVPVTGVHFEPSHWETRSVPITTTAYINGQYVPTTTSVPRQVYVPDTYTVGVRCLRRECWLEVSKDFYEAIAVGQSVRATFRVGRWSRRPRLDALSR